MDSIPEYDVFPERDHHEVLTGVWGWTVFDAATQGPIEYGTQHSKEQATAVAKATLKKVEESELYCNDCTGIEELGIDACQGCSRRR